MCLGVVGPSSFHHYWIILFGNSETGSKKTARGLWISTLHCRTTTRLIPHYITLTTCLISKWSVHFTERHHLTTLNNAECVSNESREISEVDSKNKIHVATEQCIRVNQADCSKAAQTNARHLYVVSQQKQWLKCNRTRGNAVPPPLISGRRRSPISKFQGTQGTQW